MCLRYIILLLFLSAGRIGKTHSIIKHFTVNDGLPSSEVYYVHQDFDGHLWFCTDRGVSRYNGKEFKNYGTADGLSHIVIFRIFEDSNHDLWFTAQDGTISIYSYAEKKFKEFINRKRIYPDNFVYHIGFRNDSVYLFPYRFYRKDHVLAYSHTDKNKLDRKSLATVFGSNGNIFFKNIRVSKLKQIIDSLNDIAFINRRTSGDRIDVFEKLLKEYSDDFGICPVYTEINNELYIATKESGVFILNEKGEKRFILRDYWVTSICVDRENLLWVSTVNDGVFVLSALDIETHSIDHRLNQNEKISAGEVYMDNIFLGTNTGRILKLDTHGDMTEMHIPKPIKKRHIKSFYFTNDSSTIYANNLKVVKLDSGFSIGNRDLHYLDRGSSIQYSLQFLEYMRRHKLQKKFEYLYRESKLIEAVAFGSDTLYYTVKGRLYLHTSKMENPRQFNLIESNYKYKATVKRIYKWNDLVVVLSKDSGIFFLKNTEVIYHLNDQKGLETNAAQAFYTDENKSRLWVGTNKGLFAFDYKFHEGIPEFNFQGNLTFEDGLFSNFIEEIVEFNDLIYCISPHGISILRKEYKFLREKSPKVNFIGILHKDSVYIKNGTSFRHNQNELGFLFDAAIMKKPKNSYRYRLIKDGKLTNWIRTNQSNVTLNELLPGNYKFEVSAKAKNSLWSKAHQFQFLIVPDFKDLLWVRLIFLAIVLLSIYCLFKYRIKQIKLRNQLQLRQQELQIKNLELESSTLRGQMNPHFIFNALNSIQKLILNQEKKTANQLLTKFSKLMRESLKYSKVEFISLGDEISFLKKYITLETQRFPNRFTCIFEIDPEIDQKLTEIPPLIIQPLCENAIKHAFPEDGGILIVRLLSGENNTIHIEVEDNGVGFQTLNDLNGESFGLGIIQGRLNLFRQKGFIANINISFADSLLEKGTKVKLVIPCR